MESLFNKMREREPSQLKQMFESKYGREETQIMINNIFSDEEEDDQRNQNLEERKTQVGIIEEESKINQTHGKRNKSNEYEEEKGMILSVKLKSQSQKEKLNSFIETFPQIKITDGNSPKLIKECDALITIIFYYEYINFA